jgi:hypothetical protein
MEKHEGTDRYELLPKEMPDQLMVFKSNKEYVREILEQQRSWTTNREKIVEADNAPDTYREFQDTVNASSVPSEEVIAQNDDEYRLEALGPHPIEQMRK